MPKEVKAEWKDQGSGSIESLEIPLGPEHGCLIKIAEKMGKAATLSCGLEPVLQKRQPGMGSPVSR